MTDTATEYEGYEPDDTTTARPVRVPNVSPNARSGLSGEVIGSNAALAYDENQRLADAGEPVTPDMPAHIVGVEVPEGDLETRLGWVREAEPAERGTRADAIWYHEQAAGLSDADKEVLSVALRQAVYHDGGDPLETIQGQVVESETAGTGPAINAETGEVTQPGDPLPPVEGDPDGTPLMPADATTVPDVLAWVNEAEDSDEQRKRAQVALDAEAERVDSDGEPDPRKGIVEPLEALLAASEPSGD